MYEPDRILGLLTMAMRDGNLADRVIFTLAKASAKIALEEHDNKVLQDTVQFLTRVQNGYHWIDDPIISSESRANAFSFETAAYAWQRKGSSSEQFIKDIELMIKTSRVLTEGKRPTEEDLNKTRSFFNIVFEQSLDRVDSLMRRPEIPELSDV